MMRAERPLELGCMVRRIYCDLAWLDHRPGVGSSLVNKGMNMPRYAYLAILAFGALALWIWQGENIGERWFGSDRATADQPEGEDEIRRPLMPAEKSAYANAIKAAIREKVMVYKGRVRLSPGILGGTVYVPISLISVSCETLFGVALKTPGSESEQAAPVEMVLVGLFDDNEEGDLQATVDDALDGAEFMDEMCQMVVDELERLAAH